MGVKLITPQPQREEHDYRGRAMPEMLPKYRGDEGQQRYAADTYRPGECDAVMEQAISQARLRLARGDEPDAVQAWLAEQATIAAEDEAARQRYAAHGLTLSTNPSETRGACARSLARAVILDWQNRRR